MAPAGTRASQACPRAPAATVRRAPTARRRWGRDREAAPGWLPDGYAAAGAASRRGRGGEGAAMQWPGGRSDRARVAGVIVMFVLLVVLALLLPLLLSPGAHG